MGKMFKCPACGKYTLKKECPSCGKETSGIGYKFKLKVLRWNKNQKNREAHPETGPQEI